MRILLDECLPRELAAELIGREVRTVQQEGWSSLENGALLLRASGTFSVFLTIDKPIERTQRLPANLAIVTLRARTNRIESLRPLVTDLLRALKDVRRSSGSVPNNLLKPTVRPVTDLARAARPAPMRPAA